VSGVRLAVNADKASMVLFNNNRKLVGFKKSILFGTEFQLKNQVKYLGVILDETLNWNSHTDHRMQKASIALWQSRRVIGKTKDLKPKVVYCIFTSVGGETHFDLRCLTMVEKSVTNKKK
jgi:hypothetical protein